jgi:hypothetical protein
MILLRELIIPRSENIFMRDQSKEKNRILESSKLSGLFLVRITKTEEDLSLN